VFILRKKSINGKNKIDKKATRTKEKRKKSIIKTQKYEPTVICSAKKAQ
jgi:hypothetical protein